MRNVGGHAVCEKSEAEAIIAKSLAVLEQKPTDVVALTDCVNAYNVLEIDDLAMQFAERALRSKEHPITWFNYALMLRQYGRFEEAFPYLEKAHNAWPADVFMGHVYAEELIRKGKWLEAWPLCSKYRYSKAWITPRGIPEWKGEDLAHKRLLLISEGGRGDAFWLLRFVPKLERMGAIVTFCTWADVWDFLRTHPYFTKPTTEVFFAPDKPYDYWVSVFELLQWLKVDKPFWEGPYIEAPARRYFGDSGKKQVGLCWEAGELLDVRKHRSLNEKQAAMLLSVDSVEWTSLQKDVKPPVACRTFPLASWEETASIIAGLDLVITMDTAVVHLAGAMGKPTWLVLGGIQDCKWGSGNVSGWYPSVRIFRNTGQAGFENVLGEVQKELDIFSREGVEV